MHRAGGVQLWVVEVTGAGSTDLKTDTRHKAGVLLLPVLRGVPGAIEAEVQLPNLTLVTWLSVFNRDLYVHRPHSLGIEISALDIRAKDTIALTTSLIGGTLADDVS